MTSDKILNWLRILALSSFLIAACVTAFLISADNSVKAPLLTLMGTASLIVALFPVLPTVTNIGAIIGTSIVMGGSGAWFVDATQGDVSFEYLLFRLTVAVTVIFVSAALVISFRPDDRDKREGLSPMQPKSTDRKKAVVVLALLSLILLVRRAIQLNLARKERDDAGG